MIDEIKQLLTLIQDVPDMVMHVLIGFAVYKVIIFLGTSVGIYSTIRLAINHYHSIAMAKLDQKSKPVDYKWGQCFIREPDFHEMVSLINETKKSTGQYVHASDMAFFKDAIKEKLARDKK